MLQVKKSLDDTFVDQRRHQIQNDQLSFMDKMSVVPKLDADIINAFIEYNNLEPLYVHILQYYLYKDNTLFNIYDDKHIKLLNYHMQGSYLIKQLDLFKRAYLKHKLQQLKKQRRR